MLRTSISHEIFLTGNFFIPIPSKAWKLAHASPSSHRDACFVVVFELLIWGRKIRGRFEAEWLWCAGKRMVKYFILFNSFSKFKLLPLHNFDLKVSALSFFLQLLTLKLLPLSAPPSYDLLRSIHQTSCWNYYACIKYKLAFKKSFIFHYNYVNCFILDYFHLDLFLHTRSIIFSLCTMFIFTLYTFTGEYFVYICIVIVFFLYFCVQSMYVCSLPAYLNVLIYEKVQMCMFVLKYIVFINKMLKL